MFGQAGRHTHTLHPFQALPWESPNTGQQRDLKSLTHTHTHHPYRLILCGDNLRISLSAPLEINSQQLITGWNVLHHYAKPSRPAFLSFISYADGNNWRLIAQVKRPQRDIESSSGEAERRAGNKQIRRGEGRPRYGCRYKGFTELSPKGQGSHAEGPAGSLGCCLCPMSKAPVGTWVFARTFCI